MDSVKTKNAKLTQAKLKLIQAQEKMDHYLKITQAARETLEFKLCVNTLTPGRDTIAIEHLEGLWKVKEVHQSGEIAVESSTNPPITCLINLQSITGILSTDNTPGQGGNINYHEIIHELYSIPWFERLGDARKSAVVNLVYLLGSVSSLLAETNLIHALEDGEFGRVQEILGGLRWVDAFPEYMQYLINAFRPNSDATQP